jgi:hypothetical protein
VETRALFRQILEAPDLCPRLLIDRRARIDALHDTVVCAKLAHDKLPLALTHAQKK